MIQLREEVARLKAENKELKEANSVTSLGESNGFDATTCGTSNGADGKLHLNPPKATCGAGKRCTITAVEKIAYKRKIFPCVKGKYATAENNIVARACKTCPNGKVAPAEGASSCDTCPLGSIRTLIKPTARPVPAMESTRTRRGKPAARIAPLVDTPRGHPPTQHALCSA